MWKRVAGAGQACLKRSFSDASAADIQTDVTVIGGGVIGLAVAAALSGRRRSVLLLERNSHPGQETSSRNSEVIHAGIYYQPGTNKARLCVEGKQLLYDYTAGTRCCKAHTQTIVQALKNGIPHRQLGKLIVCQTDDQREKLENLHVQARRNAVDDCVMLTSRECSAKAQGVRALAGMYSPSSGIVDSDAFMKCLMGEVQQAGGQIACNVEVQHGEVVSDGVWMHARDRVAEEAVRIHSKWMVNCGGLHAHLVAQSIAGIGCIPKVYFAKGHYFSIQTAHSFKHLIYPMPSDGGLGTHLTLDLAGRLKAGPDVEWLDHSDPAKIDYSVAGHRKAAFLSSIRQYWPQVPEQALQADYAGVRAKLHGPGMAAEDFMIETPSDHQVPGVINLYGIESPGLTSSLAIAQYVKHRIEVQEP